MWLTSLKVTSLEIQFKFIAEIQQQTDKTPTTAISEGKVKGHLAKAISD